MEPYITYKDYYTAEIGNPDIRPEYIHSFELNYSLTSGDNALSASYSTEPAKTRSNDYGFLTAGVTLDSMANVGHDYSTGIELSGSLQATSWWNTQINGSLYHYRVENEYKTDGKNETSTNYEIAWNNAFTAGKYTRIQLDGNFVGPSVTTQGRTPVVLVCQPSDTATILQTEVDGHPLFPGCLQYGPLCQYDHFLELDFQNTNPARLPVDRLDP